MSPGSGPGSTALWMSSVPTFEFSGHWAAFWVPKRASKSVQDVLPSAAFGLIEKPAGRVTVVSLIADGEGTVGLWNWGTLRLTSSPEEVSAWVVVGEAGRLGLKLSWSQPVGSG